MFGDPVSISPAEFAAHTGDGSIHFTVGSIDHTAILNVGSNTHAQIDAHIADTSVHFAQSAIDHNVIQNRGTNSHAAIDSHIGDASIHFTVGSISHTAIQDIGVNSHAAIDSHIADGSIHFTVGSISHTAIQDIGVNSHAAIDSHIADGTVHFTEASIDHTAIQNIGTNTHAQIDSHIGDATIHFTQGAIDHTAILNIGSNSHAQIDSHIADGSIHFTAASLNLPGNYLKLDASNSPLTGTLQTRAILPSVTDTYDFGSTTQRFGAGYFSKRIEGLTIGPNVSTTVHRAVGGSVLGTVGGGSGAYVEVGVKAGTNGFFASGAGLCIAAISSFNTARTPKVYCTSQGSLLIGGLRDPAVGGSANTSGIESTGVANLTIGSLLNGYFTSGNGRIRNESNGSICIGYGFATATSAYKTEVKNTVGANGAITAGWMLTSSTRDAYVSTQSSGAITIGVTSSGGRVASKSSGSATFGFANNDSDIFTTGAGSLTVGETAANGSKVLNAARGSVVVGRSSSSAIVETTTLAEAGQMVIGYAVNANSYVRGTRRGALVNGFARREGSILGSGIGSMARGYADNNTGSGSGFAARIRATATAAVALGSAYRGTVEATGQAAFALGRVLSNRTITAGGVGSMAAGYASGGNISATSTSLAFGRADTGAISAAGDNVVQLFPGSNTLANSVQIGSAGLRLKGTAGAPTTPQNGDIFMGGTGNAFVNIRSNGKNVQINTGAAGWTTGAHATLRDFTGTTTAAQALQLLETLVEELKAANIIN